MATPGSRDYASAIEALNQLQSAPHTGGTADVKQNPLRERTKKLADLADQVRRLGITAADTGSLRIVHVAGTKGKGSTAAYLESLLRASGLSTGFFSSPHLVEVRERIRLDGRPLSQREFARHFWRLHEALTESGVQEMPRYFRYLTFMAVRVFLEAKVDVAVVEVGIGGRFDSTSFIGNPWVCGITSLGHDHTSVLGDSVQQIAWHKAGIMKPGSVAVSAHSQPEESLSVLTAEAAAVGCPLFTAPDLSAYEGHERLGLESYQRVNAALALQLARLWLDRFHSREAPVADAGQLPAFPLSEEFVEAIRCTRWPGRNTVIHRGPVTFYIDGAHTVESCPLTADWFARSTAAVTSPTRVLIFNRTGDRKPCDLLTCLTSRVTFDVGLFCPNVVDTAEAGGHAETANRRVTKASADAAVRENADVFASLAAGSRVVRLGSVKEALDWVSREASGCGGATVDVLVTGSLHLVGCSLALLQPDIAFGL